jgi:hypothetical protein
MPRILGRLPSVLSFPITCPVNEVLESMTKEFGISYVVYFILLFTIYCDWFWWGWHLPINFIPFVRAEVIHMEYIKDT